MSDDGGERTEKRELIERRTETKRSKKGNGKERGQRETERESQTGKGVICHLVPDEV